MRIILLLLLTTFVCQFGESQCVPDTQWVSQPVSAIYPKPASDIPEVEGLGFDGIDAEAKIGEAYRFTWTVLVHETTGTDALNAFNLPIGSYEILFDSTIVEYHGESFELGNPVSVSNELPSGLAFEFEQSIWTPEDGSENNDLAGCFSIAGSPDEGAEAGIYALRFRIRTTVVNAGNNLTTEVVIPDRGEFQFVNFPGEYLLEINPAPIIGGGGENDVCEPNENLSPDNAIIYPLPFGVIPIDEGGFGVDKQAVINQPFEYTWTVVWPDTFIAPVVFVEAAAGTQTFFLDETSFIMDGQFVPIPDGLTLEMFPKNGILTPNTVACIKLSGTPTAEVAPGDYLITFKVESCLTIPGVFEGCMDAFIPDILSGFPGEYRLTIKPDGTTAVKETLNDKVSLIVSPNPFSSQTVIEFNSATLSGDYMFEVFNVSGEKMQTRPINMKSTVQSIVLDGSDLMDGIYFYQLRGKEGLITGKLVLQR